MAGGGCWRRCAHVAVERTVFALSPASALPVAAEPDLSEDRDCFISCYAVTLRECAGKGAGKESKDIWIGPKTAPRVAGRIPLIPIKKHNPERAKSTKIRSSVDVGACTHQKQRRRAQYKKIV